MKRKEIAEQCLAELNQVALARASQKVLQLIAVFVPKDRHSVILVPHADATVELIEGYLKQGTKPVGVVAVVDMEPETKTRHTRAMCHMSVFSLCKDRDWALEVMEKVRVEILSGSIQN